MQFLVSFFNSWCLVFLPWFVVCFWIHFQMEQWVKLRLQLFLQFGMFSKCLIEILRFSFFVLYPCFEKVRILSNDIHLFFECRKLWFVFVLIFFFFCWFELVLLFSKILLSLLESCDLNNYECQNEIYTIDWLIGMVEIFFVIFIIFSYVRRWMDCWTKNNKWIDIIEEFYIWFQWEKIWGFIFFFFILVFYFISYFLLFPKK